MPLISESDKDQFRTDGLLIRRSLVPDPLIDRARTRIDAWYEQMDTDRLDTYTQRTFAPDLGEHPDLLALFHQSGAADLVAQLIGDIAPVTTAQIQIRVPHRPDTSQPVKAMHVDGVACPHHEPAELRTFTLLAGVILSEITTPQGGALHYVPGGHLRMADWFRTAWSAGMTDQVPEHIDAEHGTPLLGRPGDILLMHHLVPHAVGPNTTPTARIMAYFRISHAQHHQQRLQALRDPWLEYPTLRPATDHA